MKNIIKRINQTWPCYNIDKLWGDFCGNSNENINDASIMKLEKFNDYVNAYNELETLAYYVNKELVCSCEFKSRKIELEREFNCEFKIY